MMFKCFRRDDAADPQTFIDAAAAILADYEDDIIATVTDPRSGIPSKQKWPPQPFEVKAACEDIEAPRRNARTRDKAIKKQLEERAAYESLPPPKQTYEEFKAEMAERGLPIDGKAKLIADTVVDVKQRYGLTDEQWAAIPDFDRVRHVKTF